MDSVKTLFIPSWTGSTCAHSVGAASLFLRTTYRQSPGMLSPTCTSTASSYTCCSCGALGYHATGIGSYSNAPTVGFAPRTLPMASFSTPIPCIASASSSTKSAPFSKCKSLGKSAIIACSTIELAYTAKFFKSSKDFFSPFTFTAAPSLGDQKAFLLSSIPSGVSVPTAFNANPTCDK